MGEHKLRERMTPEQQDQERLIVKHKTDAIRLVAARAKASWPSVTEKGDLCLNQLDYVHGEVVRNRHERRAAHANARKFGCDLYPKREKDENGREKKEGAMLPLRHGLRCQKYGEEKNERKRLDLNPDAPGWKRPRDTDTDPSVDAVTALMKDASAAADEDQQKRLREERALTILKKATSLDEIGAPVELMTRDEMKAIFPSRRVGKSATLELAAESARAAGHQVVVIDEAGDIPAGLLDPEKATGPTLEPVASDGGGGSTPEPTSEDTIAQAGESVK